MVLFCPTKSIVMVRSTFEKQGRHRPEKRGIARVWKLGILFFVALISWMAWEDFIIWVGGVPELSPQRRAKLERELEELEEAEQYVLLARKSGNFPCYSCSDGSWIFLQKGEIWKYGVTRKGEAGRYPSGLPFKSLFYKRQFEGTWQECLRREKQKIFKYAIHPENLKRKRPIIRPPGNKRDN